MQFLWFLAIIFLLFGCSSPLGQPLEQLVAETDELKIFLRTGSNMNYDVGQIEQLVEMEQQGLLPGLRVRVNARHSLVRELVVSAEYRIVKSDTQYYVAAARRMFLKKESDLYVVFGIPSYSSDFGHDLIP